MGGNRATRFRLNGAVGATTVPTMNRLVLALVAASACGTPSTVDGGTAGGTTAGGASGGATSGGSAGGASGGATSGGSAGGASGGGATSGGSAAGGSAVDLSVTLGELCDPTLAQNFLVNCRMEPLNAFSASRCLTGRWADGGMLTVADGRTLLEQGVAEACSQFGARRLRCIAPVIPLCPGVRADGGAIAGERLVQDAITACDAQLGSRFGIACLQACENALTTCQTACNRTVVDVCAPCSWTCGAEFTRCVRPCLLLPDAGFPDAG